MIRNVFAILTALFVAAANPASAQTTNRTVLVLGDSIAAGYGVDPEEGFVALLQKKVQDAKLPFTVVNGGVSGDTTSGGLRRIDWLLRRRIDVLLLELGGNDGLRGITPGASLTNLRAIIAKTKAKYPDVRVIVAGMQMPTTMGRDYTDEFAAIFPTVAKQSGATLIPFLLQGVGGDPKLNQPDMIHPNPAGHRIVAENCWTALKPVLDELTK